MSEVRVEEVVASTPPLVVDEDGVPLGFEEQERKRERVSLEDNLLALDAAIEHWSDKVTNAKDEKEKDEAEKELSTLKRERDELLVPPAVEDESKRAKSDPQEVN